MLSLTSRNWSFDADLQLIYADVQELLYSINH